MKRIKGKSLKWVLLGLAGAGALIFLAHMLWWNFHGMHSPYEPVRGGFKPGAFRQHGMMMRGYPGAGYDTEASGNTFAFLLFKIAFLLIGALLWRIGRNALKWFGAVLFFIGIFTLLPVILAVPVTAFIGYITYRVYRSSRPETVMVEPVSTVYRTEVHSNPDMLDEWERNLKKEEE